MSERNPEIESLVESLQESQISRRQFVARATALGLSLPAIGGLLASKSMAASRRGDAQTQAAVPAVTKGGTLREGYDLDFSRMDPINTTWYDPGFFALYDALVINDTNGAYVPQLAEKWNFSADGKTATFTIRKGAQFHSGR